MRLRLIFGAVLVVLVGVVALVMYVQQPRLILPVAPGSQGPNQDHPCPSGPCGPDPSGVSSVTPPTPTPTSSSPDATPVPSGDAASAAAIALAYEAARADGSWPQAWALLSDYSHAQVGSLAAYEQDQVAYNAGGGSTYIMTFPTQDPALIDPTYLGKVYADVAAHGDITRAWLVTVEHPQIHGASAGSEGLLVAPVGALWLVWVAH